jgi:activating signal cointegrator 1
MSEKIPALTIWQPWATLIALGAKKFETRGWQTSYRGPIGIHAAKKWDKETRGHCVLLRAYLEPFGVDPLALPRGCMVAVAELTDIWPTEELRPRLEASGQHQEIALGNYAPGRFGWRLQEIRPFPEPIPVRGAQGLWWWNFPVASMG